MAVRASIFVSERKVFLYKALSLGFCSGLGFRPLRAGLQNRSFRQAGEMHFILPFASSILPSLSVGLGQVCGVYFAPQPYFPPQPPQASRGVSLHPSITFLPLRTFRVAVQRGSVQMIWPLIFLCSGSALTKGAGSVPGPYTRPQPYFPRHFGPVWKSTSESGAQSRSRRQRGHDD